MHCNRLHNAHTYIDTTEVIQSENQISAKSSCHQYKSWHFPGAHTDLHPELADRHNQPNHLCCLQPHLPGIRRQEVKLLGFVVKVCQASEIMSPALLCFPFYQCVAMWLVSVELWIVQTFDLHIFQCKEKDTYTLNIGP